MQSPSNDGSLETDLSSGNTDPITKDTLLEALLFVANEENLHASKASLISGLPLVEGKLTPELFLSAAERAGLSATIVERAIGEISTLVLPAVLLQEENEAVVLLEVKRDQNIARVYDPDLNQEATIAFDALAARYSGYAIFSIPTPKFDDRAKVASSYKRAEKHWFWGVFFQSWRIYRDVLIASFLVNIFVLANPLFVMNVYDRVVPNSAIETLWALALGMFVLYSFDFILKLLRTYFIEVAGKKSDILLSSFILQRILGAKFEDHPKSVGAFVSHLREFETIRNFITSTTICTCVDLPFVFLFLAVIAYVGGSVVWVPIALMPLIVMYSWFAHSQLKKDIAHSFSASAQKNATLVEALTHLETLKTLNAEGRFARQWDVAVGQLAKWGLRSRVLSQSATTFSGLIQQVASVAVVIVGVYAIAERELTQGALIACVILSGRVLAPLSQVSGLMVQYYQSKIALDSLELLVQKPQEHDSETRFLQKPVLNGSIEARDVDFAYPDESQVSLSRVSIKISPGEHVAFIGKIGSGKSTIQKLFLGLYSAQKGNVLFNDVDISQYNPADIRSQIGYVSQANELFYGTIRENIMLGKVGFDDEELLRVAKAAGITSWVNTHPNAFERNVGERGEALSGGQKQSLTIARAMVGDPNIYIFDEPTSSMDNASEAYLIDQLKQQLANKTLIVVTHKVSLLALVDRIIVMDRGRVVADGAKDTVLDALKKGQLHVSA